ncbi:hypothetical protein [Comamonas testosteroni]|uniref:hypothetical protein n=1 Tax=Comamonas testosteroni TaxID=285 RepID=UPI0012D2D5C9|nr:hypothetical protein [Comamonas testosteroni]
MSKFKNPQRDELFKTIPKVSLDDLSHNLPERCKFNFSYFCVPDGKTGFEVWSHENLLEFINKLKEYCKKPLLEWTRQRVGRSGRSVLEIYGEFPRKSAYTFPMHVPHQAKWGRFRLGGSSRLCGFVVPDEYHGSVRGNGNHRFDCNTFYIVFIDDDHQFYLT